MTHFIEIHVNSVSGMIHITSLGYKHNHFTFIYSVYCSSTHLLLVIGSSLVSQGFLQTTSFGRNTRDLLSSKAICLTAKIQEERENQEV